MCMFCDFIENADGHYKRCVLTSTSDENTRAMLQMAFFAGAGMLSMALNMPDTQAMCRQFMADIQTVGWEKTLEIYRNTDTSDARH